MGILSRPTTIISFILTLLTGCSASVPPSDGALVTAASADDLLIIDCLLPGQVKRLGSLSTYLSARRPIKTSAVDCEIRGGEYVAFDRADYATALKIWLPVAQSGDPEAQTYVGEIYEKGLGLEPDFAMAAIWYSKASEQRFPRALINLGNLYEKGLGVSMDKAKALNYYRQAAGLENDDLLYASTVEINAVDQQELAHLKYQVTEKTRQLAQAENQLAQAQQNLARNKQALAAAQSQEKALALELYTQESKAIHEQSQALITQLREALVNAEATVNEQERRLADANAQLSKSHNEVQSQHAALEQSSLKMADASSMPVIEIIDPPMTLMRGLPTIPVASNIKEKEIIGKIQAPAGLKSFKVNGVEQSIDEYNLFWVNVPLSQKRTNIKLEAIDHQNNTVALNFSVVSDSPAVTTIAQKATPDSLLAPPTALQLGNYHALVIGNNNYRHYPVLETAINDVTSTATVLNSKFGFNTTILRNATRYEILAALNELRETLDENDNLLIYYAGHGEMDSNGDSGYWLPVDAEQGNARNWISNAAISDILNTIKAKHIMVVADSCYAGTLSVAAMPRMVEAIPGDMQQEWVEAMVQARARTVLTSGGIAPVMDGGGDGHSVFARAFIETLQSTDGLVEGHTVYQQVLRRVQSKSQALRHPQVPEYAPVRHAGHEAGEFFFQSLQG